MNTLFKVAVGAVLAVVGYSVYRKYVAKPVFTDVIPAIPGGAPAGKP